MSADWYDRLLKHPALLPAPARSKNGGAQIMAVLEQYRITERSPREDLAEQQQVLLQALAQHCAAQSPHFARRLSAAGLTPQTLAEPGGLQRLPPLTRQDLVNARETLFCKAYPPTHGRISSTSTSGSTGEPVTLRRTELCQLHWMANTLREHLWHRRDFAGRLAVLRANTAESAKNSDWGSPCNLVLRTGPAAVLPPNRSVDEMIGWLIDFKPSYLLVLPSLLGEIAAQLERTGQKLERLQGVRTLSETVAPSLRENIRRILGLEIHDAYSSQEGGVIAVQCPENSRYHVAETIIMEVVDAAGQPCGPGQIGRILITDLINFATPVIRYEIGDYALVGAPCPCGRGMPVIERFLGRERSLAMFPDGSRHWPTVGFLRWGDAFPVRQFQFIQLDRHTLEARMFADTQPTAEQEAKLTAVIQGALGYPFKILYRWQQVPLPRGPGGKFEEFLCRAQ